MSSPRNSTALFCLGLALHALTALTTAWAADEPTAEEIFEKVFKKKPGTSSQSMMMPIFLEDAPEPITELKVLTSDNPDDLQIDSEGLKQVLDKYVEEGSYSSVEIIGSALVVQSSEPGKWVPVSKFRNTGVAIAYDYQKLQLRLIVPAELRRKQTYSFRRTGLEPEPSIRPNVFSAYLNANATETLNSSSDPFAANGRDPIQTALSGAARLSDYVLEFNYNYSERPENARNFEPWMRGDVRIVTDNPRHALREMLGDVAYPVRGFQSFVAMGGVSVFSQFALQRSRLTIPSGTYELFLKRPSRVEVYINDTKRQVITLPAGRHDLRDFTFGSGMNDLRLEITDDLGRHETQTYSFYMTADRLAPGIHSAAYAIGFPSSYQGNSRVYNTSQPILSGSHRVGVTQMLTLGANLQTDFSQQLAGLEGVYASSMGSWGLEPAMSRVSALGTGTALRIKYFNSDSRAENRASRKSWGLALDRRSPSFFPNITAQSAAGSSSAYVLSGSLTRAVSDRTSLNFSAGYTIEHAGDTGYRLALGLAKRWRDGANFNVTLSQAQSGIGMADTAVAVFGSWSFPEDNQSVTAAYTPNTDTTRVDWQYSPSGNVGGFTTKAGMEKGGGDRAADASIQYNSNRAVLNAGHRVSWQKDNLNRTGQTQLQLGTALVFAGGKFAISRPVADSFIIVSAEKGLVGEELRLNPEKNGSYSASTDWLGPAVLSELSSYSLNGIKVALNSKRPGAALEQDEYTLFPPYKSGYALRLGAEGNVSVAMKLADTDGTPMALVTGEIVCLTDEAIKSQTVFTTRSGKLRADGLKPGKYELRLNLDDFLPFEFEIPEENPGVIDFGILKARTKKQ